MASGVLALPAASLAADLPLKARAAKTVYDWTGFYVGGHVAYGDASFGPGSNPLPEQGALLPHSATGFSGGYQLGYNRQLSNRVVLGIEADATFTSPTDGPALARSPVPFNTTMDYVGTVRGRAGYAFDRFMPYVTGGVAWGHTHINVNDTDGVTPLFPVGHYQAGWTAGLGLEYAVSGNWTAKAEYEYVDLSRKTYDLSGFGLGTVNVDPRIHLFKLGLNYQFGDTPWMPTAGKPKLPESDDWNVHAQTTVLPQGYGPIHSPYASPQSLPGGGQFQETWTTTAFLGARLWGTAANSISTPSSRRALVSTARSASPASPMAKRRRPARHSPRSARSATTSSRPSGSAASRKRSRTGRTSLPASTMSTASP
ncbi:opacity protein-like surface antigen [Bradyrhizobium sp. USDA 4471]